MAENPMKRIIKESLAERLAKYRARRVQLKKHVAADPGRLGREREANRQLVAARVDELAAVFEEVLPHVRAIRGRIGEMTDQTTIVACYFLFGKIAQGTRAIFDLARRGFHYEIMEIVRSNREALDLAILFLTEPPDSPLLKRWFDGDIVENVKAREAMGKFVEDFNHQSGANLPIEAMKAGVYGGLSKFGHVSYAALLDSYNVYADDFDFEQSAGFHYIRTGSLPYVQMELESLMLGLKHFYVVMHDVALYRAVDAILRRIAPRMYDDFSPKEAEIEEIRRRMTPRGD